MSDDPILSVRNLKVTYGRVEAVRGVSFDVAPGALVTLVGANGAGKSSVINAVSGMLRPRAGTITFEGRDVTRTPSHRLVEQGLVQVPEGRQILATLTIAENLQLGGWHRGGAAQRAIGEMYDRFPVLDPAAVRTLPMPTLMLSGSLTRPTHALVDAELEQLLPRPRRIVLAGASHDVWVDRAEECRAATLHFLESA